MQDLLRDVRYGVRALLKSPGLAIVATLALTLGIGLTTTMFSIVYGALMKGLPYPDGDRIVLVQRANPVRGIQRQSLPIQDFADYKAQQHVLTDLGAFTSGTIYVSGEEKAERFDGSWVTANLFDIVGVRPLLGRNFRAGEDTPSGEKVAMLVVLDVAGAIRRRMPNIIGKQIRVNGEPYTVVGVMPDGFAFPNNDKIWVPLQIDPLDGKRGEGQYVSGVRQTQARRDARSGHRRPHDDRQAPRRRVQGERTKGSAAFVAAVHRQLHRQGTAPAALHDARRRVLRAAHRVRQRREPAARPRGASHEGSRHSHGARRVARGGRASVPCRSRSCCRSRRRCFGIALA